MINTTCDTQIGNIRRAPERQGKPIGLRWHSGRGPIYDAGSSIVEGINHGHMLQTICMYKIHAV